MKVIDILLIADWCPDFIFAPADSFDDMQRA